MLPVSACDINFITCPSYFLFTATSSKTAKKPGKPPRLQKKTMNLNTYKVHALGDYVETIRQYGTTDSYSTEPVRQFDVYNITKLIINHQPSRANWNIAHPKLLIAGPAIKGS